jgi:hypothetical protein
MKMTLTGLYTAHGYGQGPRGTADWWVPAGGAASRGRLLFLHGGGYTWYAPSDSVYRSFGTRLAALSGMPVQNFVAKMGDNAIFMPPICFYFRKYTLVIMESH